MSKLGKPRTIKAELSSTHLVVKILKSKLYLVLTYHILFNLYTYRSYNLSTRLFQKCFGSTG